MNAVPLALETETIEIDHLRSIRIRPKKIAILLISRNNTLVPNRYQLIPSLERKSSSTDYADECASCKILASTYGPKFRVL